MAEPTDTEFVITMEDAVKSATAWYDEYWSTLEVDHDEIMKIAEMFKYQRFDPSTTARKCYQVGQIRGSFLRDVKTMIILALVYGNNLTLIEKRLSGHNLTTFNELKNAYGLKSKCPTTEDVTLTRVATAFAHWTCSILKDVAERLPVPHSRMLEESEGYPVEMMHVAFGNLLGPELDPVARDQLKRAHSLYLYHFTKVVHPDLKKSPAEAVIRSFSGALEAAMSSTFLASRRLAVLEKLGVLLEGRVTQAVLTAAAAFDRISGK